MNQFLPSRVGSLIVLLILFLFPADLPAQAMTPEVRKVADRFACQCGTCNNQVSTCPMLGCHSATPLREEIGSMLKQGMDEEKIVAAFVARYGKVILIAPPGRGFDLMAWTLPFGMLLLGFIIVYTLIRAWLRHKPPLLAGAGTDVSIPENYQKQIEDELKDRDS